MAIPADQLATADLLLSAFGDRVPTELRGKVQVRHRREGNSFILFEWRPRLLAPDEWFESPVAKFTYVQRSKRWKLYRMDRYLRWRRYEILSEADQLTTLCKEVEEDACCFFWG